MKRTFTFLTSLFLCIGMTMKAQPAIDTSTADAPKYYVIASYDRGGVLTNAGVDQGLTHVTLSDAGYWYFEKANNEGGVHIVNKVKDGENKVYVGSELKASTTAAVWYILPNGVNNAGLSVSKTATISSSSCIDALNYDTGVGTWNPSASDWNGTTWVVSEEKNLVDVVYNFTYNDADKGSGTAKVATAVGYEFPPVATSFPFGISATKPAGNIAESDVADKTVTKTIALEDNLPFEYAESFEKAKWYSLLFHANQRNYLYYDEALSYLDASKTAVDAANLDAYAWAFIGNPFDGFKVVNKLAGAEKILSSAAEPTADKEFPVMTKESEVTGNTTWDLTSSTYGEKGFYMAYAGTNKRLNKQDSKVCYWLNGADAGSTFMVEVASEVLSYTLTDVFGNEYTGTYLGVAGETLPTLSGAAGYTYDNAVWNGTALTANVVFPFPVSDENTTKAVMISSHNGTSLFWRAEGDNITVQKDAVADSENYYWAIYPAYAEGSFTFTIKNLGTGKFIYSTSAENKHDQGVVTLADEGSAFTLETNNKFKLPTGKYLSINSAASTGVQYLGTWGEHGGTYNQFVAYFGLTEEVVTAFNEQATAFAALESEALSSLPALQAQWTEVMTEINVLDAAIKAGDYYTDQADVDAAVASMTTAKAAIEPVVTYYTETFVAKKEAADAAMAELDEASEQYATLTEAIDVATVTTVAELEAKVAAIDTVLDYIENLPEVEYADETLINAFMTEVSAFDELSYDLDATWAALPAVLAKLDAVTPLIEQLEAGNPVAKADVEAATATVAEAKATAVYYNETYLPTAKAASALLATLEEGSEGHTALSAAIAACDLSAVTTVAELETMEAALAEAVEANTPEADPNDYTSYIKNAAVASTDDWNVAEGASYGDGLVKFGSGKVVDFNQTITLPAGQYKMTAQAAYRYGSGAVNVAEQTEYEAIKAGTDTHLAKIYAQTATYKYEGNVQNRWEGASDTDYYGNLEKVSVVDGKYVPNSSAAVKAWFDNGQYVNELVFNVQEEGEVKIGIAKTESPEAGDYTNIGAWTLTRIGDAEADPEVEEPTPDPEPEPGTWTPSEVGNGTFYLYNVGADMFMCSGNAWGSLASVAVGGVPMTLAVSDEAYTISSAAIYKDMFLGLDNQQNPFMDCGATNWTFEEVAENVYKIKIDEKVLFWSGEGTTTLGYGDDPNTEASQWMLYTEEARIAKMAEATADAPMDVTFLIKNAYFAKGNGRIVAKDADLTNSPSWKGTSLTDLWGHDTWESSANYAAEQYGKQFDNYQELKNIPNGVYHMTAKGFYRGSVVPYIYANDEKCELKVKGDIGGDNLTNAAKAMSGNDYLLEGVKVTVEDGTLRVGIKSDESMEWCVFDDFQLTYYGAPEWATEEQKQALSEAIAEAEGHILGFAAGEYAPYTNVEALKTLAAAKAVDADNALAGEITAVLETLAAAVWTENAEEMNAIYDGSFEYAYSTEGNVQPIAWHGINNHDNATDIRYMWNATANAGLTATSTGKALFTKYNAFYGTEAGYTMPLKENTEYELTFIYGGWSDCQKDGYVTITGPEDVEIALSTDRLPLDAVNGHESAESWKTYKATFTTGAAGNYVLGLRKDREIEAKQSQYVYGDFKLYAVPAEPEYLTVVSANVGDVAIEEGAATVSSISTIDVIFDRPVALAENAGWATVTDEWGENSLKAEVLAENNCAVRFSLQWGLVIAEEGNFPFYVPEGLIIGAEDANYINAEITATITVEAAPATPLTVTNVTVGEDVMADFSAIAATPEDMIKVNFDGQFYFQGMPSIVDAEGNDASEYFQWMNGMDVDGSNSYIFMAQNWQGTVAPAGVYTITLAKASFMEMMSYKAPAEDIVLTVQIIVDEEPVEVTEIKIATDKGDSYAELMEKGATLQLVATVTPENATTAITWSSDNELVSVSETGLVTLTDYCPEIAWVTITATAANGVSATFGINVYAPQPGTVTGITLNATWKDLEVKSGDTFQLVATVEPADATDKTVTWTSNADFATVDANGLVTFTGTPEDGGTVTITATASNGMTATCMLSVTFVADDTAIESIKADTETVIYDIHGRRVTEMTKGVYIVNGKKVVKK